MSQETPYIFDATTADFDQSVIEILSTNRCWWISGPNGVRRARR
jgi:hypothetical protein